VDVPRVLAILVAHNGMQWLDEALDALDAQTYPAIDLVAVDNASSDGSRERLLARLGEGRVLVTESDIGFGGAIAFALDSDVAHVSDADFLLLLHDDLVLDPSAVEHLVAELQSDPRLGVVGPKLLVYDQPRVLQSVGMSIDVTGRAESGLELDELDQGQHDHLRPVLYVSSAGMLARRDVFEKVGRFDRRYGLFREDLDLCWRVWLSGHDVEVVPSATGRHARAASTYLRDGAATARGSRFLAERNTLATLLKCYSFSRLIYVIPMFFIVGLAKVVGFLVTRRVADALETVRAWGWNVSHLRSTKRLRWAAQDGRVRSDAELRPLFVRIIVRARAYVEAVAGRVVGGDEGITAEEKVETRRGPRRPVLVVVIVIALLGIAATVPLLGAGPLRGGDLATWPSSPMDFLHAYAAVYPEAGGVGATQPISPVQAIFALIGFATGGSAWIASRILVVGAIPAAWLAALPAIGQVTERRGARIAGATLYALSPPSIAAVTSGHLGGIAAVVLLPGIAITGRHLFRVRGPRDKAWRASAAAALLIAVLVAFEPTALLVVVAAAAVGFVAVAGVAAPVRQRVDAGLRVVAVLAGAMVLLLPWSATLLRPGSPVLGGFFGIESSPAPFARWALLVPDLAGFPGLLVGLAFPAAAALGVFLAAKRSPVLVGSLAAASAAAVVVAWGLGRSGSQAVVWPGLALLLAAGGYAALFALGLDAGRDRLTGYAFGWRQVTAVGLTGLVAAGAVGAAVHLVSDPFASLVVASPALPAFIGAEEEQQRRYRVLVLNDTGEAVEWDLVGSDGPTMLAYGTSPAAEILDLTDDAVADLVSGATPTAAARLGHANVLYLYVPEGGRSQRLETALESQLRLEPQAVEYGLVFRIRDWLPRATYLPPRARHTAVDLAPLPPGVEPVALDRVEDLRWQAHVDGPGVIAVAEPAGSGWEADLDGETLRAIDTGHLTRFVVPQEGTVTISRTGGPRRLAEVTLQGMAALVALSLALRAPGFARRSTLAREAGE
jgi:GT2 family glycosyltransferase